MTFFGFRESVFLRSVAHVVIAGPYHIVAMSCRLFGRPRVLPLVVLFLFLVCYFQYGKEEYVSSTFRLFGGSGHHVSRPRPSPLPVPGRSITLLRRNTVDPRP